MIITSPALSIVIIVRVPGAEILIDTVNAAATEQLGGEVVLLVEGGVLHVDHVVTREEAGEATEFLQGGNLFISQGG